MSENSINIPFSLKKDASISINDLKDRPKVYFVPSYNVCATISTLTKSDTGEYNYTIEPKDGTVASNIRNLKYDLKSNTIDVSWDVLIAYLIDCHEQESLEYNNDNDIYYIRWFGTSSINGYNLINDSEYPYAYNYANTISNAYDTSTRNSKYMTFGHDNIQNNAKSINYYTDTMTNTVTYVGIKSFNLHCKTTSSAPAQITCTINNRSISLTRNDWTGPIISS